VRLEAGLELTSGDRMPAWWSGLDGCRSMGLIITPARRAHQPGASLDARSCAPVSSVNRHRPSDAHQCLAGPAAIQAPRDPDASRMGSIDDNLGRLYGYRVTVAPAWRQVDGEISSPGIAVAAAHPAVMAPRMTAQRARHHKLRQAVTPGSPHRPRSAWRPPVASACQCASLALYEAGVFLRR